MLAGMFDYPISHLRLLQNPCIIRSKGLAGSWNSVHACWHVRLSHITSQNPCIIRSKGLAGYQTDSPGVICDTGAGM